MNWLNIHTAVLRSPAFIGSEPVARATWLYVFAFCAEQENGGRIIGARAWKDRQWQQTCGVTIAEVESSHPLLSWEADDLIVNSYPKQREKEVKAKRTAGAKGGRASGRSRKQAQLRRPGDAVLGDSFEAEPQRKGKEGEGERKENEMEGEGSGTAVPAEPSPAAAQGPRNPGARALTEPDEVWIASLSQNPGYAGVDVKLELGKAQAWAGANRRVCNRRFFVNWLNRAVTDARTVRVPQDKLAAGGF